MKIGFIGAGKVGCSLGSYFGAKHELVGYASKPHETAIEAAEITGSHAFSANATLIAACDIIFITTPDAAIAPTWDELLSDEESRIALHGKIVCHCSGALPSAALHDAAEHGAHAYSLHPLFAIPSKTVDPDELQKAFFTLEGDPKRLKEMEEFIELMGNRHQVIDAAAKTRYHAAAALASNHVVALYCIASKELARCGFDAHDAELALAPLFLGNAAHIAQDGALASLTGPAERGDTATIEKHLACLEGRSHEVYRILNAELLELAAEKHGRR